MTEGQQAIRELSSHSLAGTLCSPDQFVVLASPVPPCCWQHHLAHLLPGARMALPEVGEGLHQAARSLVMTKLI